MLGHAFALLSPLVLVGLVAAARRCGEPVPRALLLWAGGTLVLSLFTVKVGGYAYVVVPAWAGLAALGAHALARWRRVGVVAAVALSAVAIAGAIVRDVQRLPPPYHAPGLHAVAAAVAPRLADVPPQRACFVGPEWPTLSFHLFRSGGYWGTPLAPWTAERHRQVEADTTLRVFVVDPSRELYGGWPDSATVAWLETATTEITDEVVTPAGAPAGSPRGHPALRVFVR